MTSSVGGGMPDGNANGPAGPRPKPGTPSLLRELNDRAALELLLAEGSLTRAQISERTGVSKVTVSQMLARLEDRGLVMIAGEQAGGRGPNAALYSVVRYLMFCVIPALVSDAFFRRFESVLISLDKRSIAICNRRDSISPISLIESKSFFIASIASPTSFVVPRDSLMFLSMESTGAAIFVVCRLSMA